MDGDAGAHAHFERGIEAHAGDRDVHAVRSPRYTARHDSARLWRRDGADDHVGCAIGVVRHKVRGSVMTLSTRNGWLMHTSSVPAMATTTAYRVLRLRRTNRSDAKSTSSPTWATATWGEGVALTRV